MARFMIFGSVGWDRPIWLDRKLDVGGRILGFREQSATDTQISGRLGGGAANAAACLANAGHDAAVWSITSPDQIGDQIEASLATLGVNCDYLKRHKLVAGTTWILIAPDGERTILFEHSDPNLNRTLRRLQKQQLGKIEIKKVEAYGPNGVYLRSAFDGFADLNKLSESIIVSHWPQLIDQRPLPADILIGSKDDLITAGLYRDAFDVARKACAPRFKWLIVTDGKRGGEIYSRDNKWSYASPYVEQLDATGAGDSFAAGVLEAMTAGADIVEAASHGAVWGAKSASLPGSAEPRPEKTYLNWARVKA
ncbi:MAG: carbohydrate kinase family protein [Pseudomonadota bacterium]